MKIKIIIAAIICIIIGTYWLVSPSAVEMTFRMNEQHFQQAADAYIKQKRYTGVKQWLTTMPPGEGAEYLPFHMGQDYTTDFYKPRIIYILSDNPRKAPPCSFDGKLIKKIKDQWYICQESRF